MEYSTSLDDLPNNTIQMETKELPQGNGLGVPAQQNYSGAGNNVSNPMSSTGNGENIMYSPNVDIGSNNSAGRPTMQMKGPADSHSENTTNVMKALQNPNVSSATNLPSRDIPMLTQEHTQDVQSRPNHIPETNIGNYIENTMSQDDVVDAFEKKRRPGESDDLYDELQEPIMIAILFFAFKLPIVKKKLRLLFPSIYESDGNLNFGGFLLQSALFGFSYYAITKGIYYINKGRK